MKNKTTIFKLIATAAIITLGACAKVPQGNQQTLKNLPPYDDGRAKDIMSPQVIEQKITRVGVLAPLSGELAEVGRSVVDSLHLALDDRINQNPNVFTKEKIIIIPEDVGTDEQSAEAAARRLIAKNPHIIIGPILSRSVSGAMRVSEKSRVPMLTFSNNRTVAIPNTYILGFMIEDQIVSSVEYAISQGVKRFALLAPDNLVGENVAKTLNELSQKYPDISIESVELYPANSPDAASEIRRLSTFFRTPDLSKKGMGITADLKDALLDQEKQILLDQQVRKAFMADRKDFMPEVTAENDTRRFQALIIPEGGDRLLKMANNLIAYGLTQKEVQLIGSSAWDELNLYMIPEFHGAYFASSNPRAVKSFQQRFSAIFGYTPPRLATIAYDAMSLVTAITVSTPAPDFSPVKMSDERGFIAPINGLFRLNPDGTSQRGFAIVHVTKDGVDALRPPPKEFPR